MDGSNPEHYPIADFVNWYKQKELILNPEFQRGSVWSSQARSYLIDSVLRGYPLPKLLMRTRIDRSTRKTIRDVVDGQQRLRTIIEFVENRFTLGKRAQEFEGMRFDDLDDDVQDKFLAYKLTSEQLINASDDDVLEVFVRINSYTVPVNDAELRNAKFDNEFSNVVKATVRQLGDVWELGVIPPRARVRMADQSLIAEIYGFRINGIGEGGEAAITKLYQQMDKDGALVPDPLEIEDVCRDAAELLEPFRSQRIVQRPHFLILVAVLGYLGGVLRPGRIDVSEMPILGRLIDVDAARESLGQLNDALSGDLNRADLQEFIDAARSSTQRIKSRQTRFSYFYKALSQA